MPRVSRIKKEKVLINDADSSVYAIGFMTQQKMHYLTDSKGKIQGQWKLKTELNKWQKEHDPMKLLDYDFTEDIQPKNFALSSAKNFVKNILAFTGCHRSVLLLTKGGNCFRHHLATIQKYKGNRDKLTKPHHYDNIRNYYIDHHGAKVYDKWEADDAACMALHRGSGIDGVEYVLSTIDKDLAQQAGLHVNPNKKDEGVYVITEVDGWRNFYHQMLMGDKADNIKGLSGKKGHPGIGKVKASKLLEPAGDDISMMCQIVYDAYCIRYGLEPFSYAPWWMDEETNPDNEFYGVKQQVLTGTAMSMFRENADLLYMLRTPTDQYMPHCRVLLDQWTKYPEGTVNYYIPVEEDDETQ